MIPEKSQDEKAAADEQAQNKLDLAPEDYEDDLVDEEHDNGTPNDDDLADDSEDEESAEDSEGDTPQEAMATDEDADGVPDAPGDTDWEEHGPVLWRLLHKFIGSPKQKHDGHYQIKVDDKTVGDTHDAIAAIKTPPQDE